MAVVGTVADLRGMGPADAGRSESLQHQQFVNLMTLIEFDENLEPAPYLAESWEVSEDLTELTFQLLTPSTSQKLEAFMTEWEPGEQRPLAGFGGTTEEFIYVLQGQLEIWLGEDAHLLGPGDTACFEGAMLRDMKPRGDQTVRFISVITPPAF